MDQSAFRYCLPLAFGALGIGMFYALLFGRKVSNLACSTVLFTACALFVATVVSLWPLSWNTSLSFNGTAPIYLAGLVPLTQHLDPLSSMFLFLLGFVGCAAAIFSPSYLKHFKHFHGGIYWFELFAFVMGMAQVLLADNAIVFLFFWEIMSIGTAGLVITDPSQKRARNAALVYLGATRISTTLLFAGFLWLHVLTNSWEFSVWNAHAYVNSAVPYLLIFVGLCIKAGVWPFHQWLPFAHPEAPAPVSALMSGIMVKVAIYMMLRLLVLSHGSVSIVAYMAVFFGMISAFWGILYATMMRDLKQLLAYSTVENVGLIVLSLGLLMLGKKFGLNTIMPLAIAACLFHIINHAMYKSLLFLGSGAVDAAAHTRDLNFLGGLHKGMPWTTLMFFIGAISICALPPLNGFASKWLIYQSAFHFALVGRIPYRAAALVIISGMALVGALSVASFTKAFGFAFLGRPKTKQAEHAVELSTGSKVSQAMLAIPCLALGFAVPSVLTLIAPVCKMIVPAYDAAGLFTIPQPQLFQVMAGLIIAVYLGALADPYNLKAKKVRSYVTWECGYGEVPARSVIGPDSFVRSIAELFSPILQYRVFGVIRGGDRRHFPELIRVTSKTVPLLTYRVYRPLMFGFSAISRGLIRLQTSSIHVHLLYVFATLLVLIIIGTHL